MTEFSNIIALRNARVPASVTSAQGLVPDREGLCKADIVIRNGMIEAIAPPSACIGGGAQEMDVRDGQVWPLFVDMHAHLDKGQIWPRASNRDGTHRAAARAVAADRVANWSAQDVAKRFDFALRCADYHGTGAIRTHLDCYERAQAETTFAVFDEEAKAWKGRIVLQPVTMARLDGYDGQPGERLARLAAERGGLLGGILKVGSTYEGRDDGAVEAGLRRLFTLAADHRLDIDLHVDETGDPASLQLLQVAETALAMRFPGRITCGHCCNLSVQDAATTAKVIAAVRDAGISVVTLPLVNTYLQDRTEGTTPTWRGLTRIRELKSAGVTVIAASDNTRDPFYAYGDLDGMEVFRDFVRLAHLDQDAGDWIPALTALPADVMGLKGCGRIAPGSRADLLLFSGRSMGELLARPQSDRRIMRGGVIQNAIQPDYRELDGLFRNDERDDVRWTA